MLNHIVGNCINTDKLTDGEYIILNFPNEDYLRTHTDYQADGRSFQNGDPVLIMRWTTIPIQHCGQKLRTYVVIRKIAAKPTVLFLEPLLNFHYDKNVGFYVNAFSQQHDDEWGMTCRYDNKQICKCKYLLDGHEPDCPDFDKYSKQHGEYAKIK